MCGRNNVFQMKILTTAAAFSLINHNRKCKSFINSFHTSSKSDKRLPPSRKKIAHTHTHRLMTYQQVWLCNYFTLGRRRHEYPSNRGWLTCPGRWFIIAESVQTLSGTRRVFGLVSVFAHALFIKKRRGKAVVYQVNRGCMKGEKTWMRVIWTNRRYALFIIVVHDVGAFVLYALLTVVWMGVLCSIP